MDLLQATHSSALATLKKKVPTADVARLDSAMSTAESLYKGHTLDFMTNVTLFQHAIISTIFLAEFCHDEDALIASILQHTLKIPEITPDVIEKKFGKVVRDLVSRIHLLSYLYSADGRKSVDDMKSMIISVSDDIRVLLIVLSVASAYLQNLARIRPQYRMRLCRQALHLFAPIAARLGIYALKYRLERTAFPECYPSDAQLIERQISLLHDDNGAFLPQVSSAIRSYLTEQGIPSEVMGREKQSYSIFQKMQTKSVTSLEKITDLFAIRVVVPTMQDCYRALGFLHRLGTPISHRFKDYISFPKPNGYQSLHTCILGLPHAPKDMMIEVQIRTSDMHQEAEYGIAAHWLYKQTGKKDSTKQPRQFHLADVFLQQKSTANFKGAPADVHTTLVDHIYTLTPHGDIIELPEGGTPLDFAFHVHTDLGLRFKSARVNGSIVPIAYPLENGDVVEILTHKYARPALQWMEDLKTSSARSKLKAYFFSHNRPQFLLRGKELLNLELKTRHLPLLDSEVTLLATFDGKALPLRDREDVLVKIGMGSMRTSSVFRHSALEIVPRKLKKSVKITKKKQSKTKSVKSEQILGIENEKLTMPHRYAKCCSPELHRVKKEKLIGVIARSGIIVVHREVCRMGKSASVERKLKMFWVS